MGHLAVANHSSLLHAPYACLDAFSCLVATPAAYDGGSLEPPSLSGQGCCSVLQWHQRNTYPLSLLLPPSEYRNCLLQVSNPFDLLRMHQSYNQSVHSGDTMMLMFDADDDTDDDA